MSKVKGWAQGGQDSRKWRACHKSSTFCHMEGSRRSNACCHVEGAALSVTWKEQEEQQETETHRQWDRSPSPSQRVRSHCSASGNATAETSQKERSEDVQIRENLALQMGTEVCTMQVESTADQVSSIEKQREVCSEDEFKSSRSERTQTCSDRQARVDLGERWKWAQ